MYQRLFLWSLTSALAGFLFGFDTIVISGAEKDIQSIGSALAPEQFSFIVSRFSGGVGVGIATGASPLYIAEISPPQSRGRMAGLFQFNIVFGILIAFLSNFVIG